MHDTRSRAVPRDDPFEDFAPPSTAPDQIPPEAPDNPRAIVHRLDPRWRGTSLQLFNLSVQAGFTTPFDVAAYVLDALQQRTDAPSSSPEQRNAYAEVRRVLLAYPEETVAYAQVTIRYESLAAQEKEIEKARRREAEAREAKATIPPSEPQLKFLRDLGHNGEAPQNMAAASALISELKSRRAGR